MPASLVPPPPGSLDDGGHGRPASVLRAWLYEVDQDGTSRPMNQASGRSMKTVPAGSILHVCVEGGRDTPRERYLKASRAEGMASEPVTVGMDTRTGYWVIRNSGRTNSLRVQPYGLFAVPLHPRTSMPMAGEDVAVWIPVVPRGPRASEKSEGFRLLILNVSELPRRQGETRLITVPRHHLTGNMREALIAYFGSHLSWPPLPAPHVRQQQEVEDIAVEKGLAKLPDPKRWARNRHDVLAGRDGLFTAADWYPRLGGPGRSIANHLAAFHRLVELRTITLPRVRRWAAEHEVEPYIIIDRQLC